MGILSNAAALFDFSRRAGLNLDVNLNTGIASSFENTLSTIVGPEGFSMVPGESEALTVPAVARAIQLYSVASAKLTVDAAPAWWESGNGALTSAGRMSALVQSLFFHGRAVLWVSRDGAGKITNALLLPAAVFGLDIFGNVLLKGKPVPPALQSSLIYIPSLLPQGFLTFGKDAVKHYLGLRDSILSRSRNPIPVVELKIRDAFETTPDELETARKNWQIARTSENGAVAVTPAGVDVIIHGDKADTSMLTEARNAVRLDVANFANINASLLDGNNGTSDNYSNTLQNKDEFVDLSLDTFLLPIEARLSMLDVATDGTPFRFNRDALNLAPPAVGNTGTAVERPATTTEGLTTE